MGGEGEGVYKPGDTGGGSGLGNELSFILHNQFSYTRSRHKKN